MRCTFIQKTLFLFILTFSMSATATLININTNEYTGEWYVDSPNILTGDQTLDLSEGIHSIQIAESENFLINVDSNGVVTLPGNGGQAIGGQNSLSFNTVAISVDPSDYLGQWQIRRVSPFTSGTPETIHLVANSRYTVSVGEPGRFLISISDDANIIVENGVSAFSNSPTSLTFNTTDLNINPADYLGEWFMRRVTSLVAGPLSDIKVVPGMSYNVTVGVSGAFLINVNADSSIEVQNGSSAFSPSPTNLTFNTIELNVDAGEFLGEWEIRRVTPNSTGNITAVRIVPDVNYNFLIGVAGSILIRANADGSFIIPEGVTIENSSANNLLFLTENVNISSSEPSATWIIRSIISEATTGDQDVELVGGLNYRFQVGASEIRDIFVSSPCSVDPESLEFSTTTLVFTCLEEEEIFQCVKKQDYLDNIDCSGSVTVNSSSELEAYLTNFGLENGSYQNLEIDFDIAQERIEVHSPCRINVRKERSLLADQICLDGREGVFIGKWSELSGEEMTFISENKDVQFGKYSKISGGNLSMEASLQSRIRRHASINLSGDISITSTGIDTRRSRAVIQAYSHVQAKNILLSGFSVAALRHDSTYHAETLSVESKMETIIGFSNLLNVSNDISLSSAQDSSRVVIRRDALVNATNLFINSEGEARLRRRVNVNVSNILSFSTEQCTLGRDVELNFNEKQGSCY